MKITPPFGDSPFRESLAAQRRIGKAAVKRDYESAYRAIQSLSIFTDPTNQALGATLARFIKRGQTLSVRELLIDIGFKNPDVALEAIELHIRTQRISRGRLKKKPIQQLILRRPSVNRLLRTLLNRVGQAKAGWPLEQAGVKAPAWIKRHNSPSIWQDRSNSKDRPSIVFGNRVRYIQRTGGQLRIIKRVLRNRTRQLERATEHALRRNAARANA